MDKILNEKILDLRRILDSAYIHNSFEIPVNSCYKYFSVIDQPSIKREHFLLLNISQGSHCTWKILLEIQFLKQEKSKIKIKKIITQIMK